MKLIMTRAGFISTLTVLLLLLCAFAESPYGYPPTGQFIHGSDRFFMVRAGDYYYLYDGQKDDFVAKTTYDTILGLYTYSATGCPAAVVKSGGRFGLLDVETGKEVLAPAKSSVTEFSDGVYLPHLNPMKWEVGGRTVELMSQPLEYGQQMLPFSWEDIFFVAYYTYEVEDCAPNYIQGAYSNGRVGIRDGEGNEVAPPTYNNIWPKDSDNIGYVAYIGNKCGIINERGEVLAPFVYDDCDYTAKNRRMRPAIMRRDGFEGLVNAQGREITKFEYAKLFYFNFQETIPFPEEYNIIAYKDVDEHKSVCGMLDIGGNEIIPVKYDRIIEDYHSRYLTGVGGKYGLRNFRGEQMLPEKYDSIRCVEFSERDIFIMDGGKWGIADTLGNVTLAPNKLDEIKYGLSAFYGRVGAKWGIFDRTGNFSVAPQYDEMEIDNGASDYKNTFFAVRKGEKWYRIDVKGSIKATFDDKPNTSGIMLSDF